MYCYIKWTHEARECQSCFMTVTISWLGQEISFSPKPSWLVVGPSQFAVQWISLSTGLGVMFITCLHLVPRLRMSGGVPPFLLYTFVAWAGTTLHFIVCQFSSFSVCSNPVTALQSFLKWAYLLQNKARFSPKSRVHAIFTFLCQNSGLFQTSFQTTFIC